MFPRVGGALGGWIFTYSKMKPKKKFGQNFLIDEKYISALVSAARVSKKDVVVEVGAGTGALTKELAKKAKKVIAFEIDRDLIPPLKAELEDFSNVKIINKDFLRFTRPTSPPPDSLRDSKRAGATCPPVPGVGRRGELAGGRAINDLRFTDYKLVGSIPYDMTSPLIHKLLDLRPRPSLVVLLIQREVAEKICAQPPRATYLSNIVQLLGEIQIIDFVPRKAFWPKPKVNGAIVKWKMDPPKADRKRRMDYEKFSEFLHRGFQHPRKMLRNKFDSPILRKVGIAPTQRAQRLSLENWLKLYKLYSTI